VTAVGFFSDGFRRRLCMPHPGAWTARDRGTPSSARASASEPGCLAHGAEPVKRHGAAGHNTFSSGASDLSASSICSRAAQAAVSPIHAAADLGPRQARVSRGRAVKAHQGDLLGGALPLISCAHPWKTAGVCTIRRPPAPKSNCRWEKTRRFGCS
jgi:hypothetical protein